MRRVLACIVAFGAATAAAVAMGDDSAKPTGVADIATGLRSESKDKRLAAVAAIETMEAMPPELVTPFLSYLMTEMKLRFINAPPTEPKTLEGSKVYRSPDDVSLTRIKSDPPSYIGQAFSMTGVVSVSDYYNYGYRDSASTHYSFAFQALNQDGETIPGEDTHVYLDRSIGRVFAERIVQGKEKGFDEMLVRLRCTIFRGRVGEDDSEALSNIAVIDWQVSPEGKSSRGVWAIAGITQNFVLLAKAGSAAVEPLVKLITSEDLYFDNASVDRMVREAGSIAVARMAPEDQSEARKQLTKALLQLKATFARVHAQKCLDLIGNEPSAEPAEAPRSKATPKESDSARAATLLKLGQNLEKANKTKGAIGYYRQIIKDHLKTPQAKIASERLKALADE